MKKNNLTALLLTVSTFLVNGIAFAQSKNLADTKPLETGSTEIQTNNDEQSTVDPTRFGTVVVIQGLNKITAKTSLLEIKIGDTIHFGKLLITAHKCWQAPLEQKPDSKILLEIYDNEDAKSGNGKKRIFYGWMFSSSPSISALEHPIYDITAVGCKNK